MSRPNVDEYQIAQLMRDFTRSALLAQPENLVIFAQQYDRLMNGRCLGSIFEISH